MFGGIFKGREAIFGLFFSRDNRYNARKENGLWNRPIRFISLEKITRETAAFDRENESAIKIDGEKSNWIRSFFLLFCVYAHAGQEQRVVES